MKQLGLVELRLRCLELAVERCRQAAQAGVALVEPGGAPFKGVTALARRFEEYVLGEFSDGQ